jgi:cytochrome c551/c552
MKTAKIILIAISVIIIAACSTSKKSTSSDAAPAPTTTTNTTSPSPFFLATPGTYAPGNEELTAIQKRYSDITLDKLREGHAIYTTGACTRCHASLSIYNYGEEKWKEIIDVMAFKANISDEEKDAVYKYVLSMKATQPK